MELDILELDLQGLSIFLLGPLMTVFFCEVYKFVSKAQIKAFADKVRKQSEDEEKARIEKFAEYKTGYIECDDAPTPSATKIEVPAEAPPQLAETANGASA